MYIRVPLQELIASGIRLRPAEAVAIVGELCRQRAARVLPGLPSLSVIRLTSHGEIAIEGPVPTGDDHVQRAGLLLEELLAGFDAPPEYRASGALRLVVARALGTLDLPPFADLEEFCAALVRFTTVDARETVLSLVAAWSDATTATTGAAIAVADSTPAAEAPPRWRPIDYAIGIGAPAAAAVLGYLLALPAPSARAPQPASVSIVEAAKPEASIPQTPTAQPAPPVEPTPVATAGRAPQMLQPSAFSPSFASSGAVYFHEQHGGASVLKVGHSSGAGAMKVTTILDDRSRNFHPRPSPDGSRIAFDSDRDGVRAVYVANTDGSGIHRISGDGYASVPSWSPDGRRLVFVRAEAAAPKVWNLWLANSDGSGLRRLTRHRVGQAWGGSWFPDGRRIAYSVESQLIILDISTGTRRVLASPRPGRLARTPAVSPDGRRIVFQVHHDGTWLLDVATGAMTRVLADPTAEEFTWAPDGRHIAYHSRRGGTWSVWVMPV